MEQLKIIAEIAEALMTAAGIFVAGWWTYLLFIRQRAGFPKAKLSHSLQTVKLSDDKLFVRASTDIENTGSALISLGELQTRLNRVLPLTPELSKALQQGRVIAKGQREADWPLLGLTKCAWKPKEAEIEPGESETIVCDFIVDAPVEVVELYSFAKNEKKRGREIGWHCTTLLPLSDPIGAPPMPKPEPLSPPPNREERQLPPRPPITPPTITPQLPPRPDPPPPPPPLKK